MAPKSNFIVRGGANFSQINKALNQTQAQFGKFQSKISGSMKLVTAALSGLAIGKFIKDSTQAAMTVESSVDQISRTLGNNSGEFNKWANTQAKAFGMARVEAFKYGDTYSNLLSGFIKDTKENEKYTVQLLQSSAVVASKTGRTIDDTLDRIRSGLLGNTEAIEDLGINVNVAMIQSTKAFQQFANGKSWQKLDFQTQQQIRLMAILEQANLKYGDSLAGTTATKQQMFIATLKNIQLNLGQAFLPIYNTILPALTAFASQIEKITAHFAAFTQALFGKSVQYKVDQTASSISGQADAVTDLGNETDKAGKKAKKALAGFDEINQLTAPSSSSGSGGSGGSSSGSGGTKITPIETTVDTSLLSTLNKLKDAATPTIDAIKRLGAALEPVKNFVATGLKSFYTDVLVPIGKWILGTGLPALLDIITNLLKKIDWDKLSEAFSKFNKAIAPFAIAVGTGLISFIQSIAELLTPVISGAVSLFASGLSALADAINMVPEDVARMLGSAIAGMVTSILLFKGAQNIGAIITGIKDSLSGFVKTIKANPLLLVAAAIGAIVGALTEYNKIKFDASNLGQFFKSVDDLNAKSKKSNEELQKNIEDRSKIKLDVEGDYAAIKILSDRYFDLAGNTKLTNDQQLLLKSYAQELIKKIPELSGYIDEQTGYYKGTRDEIEKLIDKSKEYFLVQAAQDDLLKITKDQYTAEKNLKDLEDKRKIAVDNLKISQDKYSDAMKTGYQKDIKTYAGEVLKCRDALKEIDKQVSDTKGTQEKLSKEWQFATDYITDYASTTQKEVGKISDSVNITSAKATKNATQMGKDIVDSTNQSIFANAETSKTALFHWTEGINKIFNTGAGSEKFIGNAKEMVSGFNTGVDSNYASSQSHLSTWSKKVSEWFNKDAGKGVFTTNAKESINGFKSGIQLNYTSTQGSVKTWANNINSTFTGIASNSAFSGYGNNIVSGLNSGVSNKQNTSKNIFQTWASSIKGWFTSAFDIHSPSKVSFGWAENVVSGFNNGIKSMQNTSKSYMDKWAESIGNIKTSIGVGVDFSSNMPDMKSLLSNNGISGIISNEISMSANNDNPMHEMANMISTAIISQMNNRSTPVEVPLYLDGEELARGLYNGQQRFERRMNPIAITP